MKKIFRSFTFYFLLASMIIITTHIRGGDSHGIVLFHLNPVLKVILQTDFANTLDSGIKIMNGSIQGETSVYWYAAHFLSFGFMGAVLDMIKFLVQKGQNKKTAGLR